MSKQKGKSFELQLLETKLVRSILTFFNLQNAMRSRETFNWTVYRLCFFKNCLFSPRIESHFTQKEYLQQFEIHLQAGSSQIS